MSLKAIVCFLAACFYVSNEAAPEYQAMVKWASIQKMKAISQKFQHVENRLDQFHELFTTGQFDLMGGVMPEPKPISELNLTQACAEDVQFFRDSRQKYKEETIAMAVCAFKNNSECLNNHTEERKKVGWTLEQMDSIGKPPSGILRLNLYWHGSYQECIGIDVERPKGNYSTSGRYKGKYCQAMMSYLALLGVPPTDCPSGMPDDWINYVNNIHWSLCIPSTCTQQDALALIGQYDRIKSMACNVFCEEEEEFSTAAIAVIALFSVIGALVVIAAAVDYVQEGILEQVQVPGSPHQRYFATKLLICFSIYSNGKKILDMSKRSGQLDCLHGIRVLSMLWVVLGHTYLHIMYSDNQLEAEKITQEWSLMAINNATFSVDTFFTMSGFLVAYLWLREEEKNGRNFIRSPTTWIGYYVHRYIRLTPVFMLILGMNATLIPYFFRGPHQFEAIAAGGRDCAKYWWTNILYVNNIVDPAHQCYGPAWYLPNDMQFYWLAPIFLLLLLFSPMAGFVLSIALTLASMAATAATVVVYRFPAGAGLVGAPNDPLATDGANASEDYMRLVYMAPWTRFPAYLIGILFGYAWQKGLCKMKMSKLTALFIWIFAIACGLAIVYGLIDNVRGTQLPVGIRAFYGAVSRPAWSICICWVMYACLIGRGGIINEFLCWRGWLPLSRLSYCIYLLHYTIIEVVVASSEYPLHWDTHLNWVTKWIGFMGITLMASFFVSCAMEAPVIGLEKLLLNPLLEKTKQPQVAPEKLITGRKIDEEVVNMRL